MAVTWLLLIVLGMLAEGRRVPRQYFYGGPESHSRSNSGKVSIVGPAVNSVAICSLRSSHGYRVTGEIVLKQPHLKSPVDITGAIAGLSEGKHGIHIHQNGNIEDNCMAAGSHFNPGSKTHGGPEDSERHVGDLGNIIAEKDGTSNFHILDKHISLNANSNNYVIGRSIVIHAKEDDLGKGINEESKKTGNAGARVACCVIEPIERSI